MSNTKLPAHSRPEIRAALIAYAKAPTDGNADTLIAAIASDRERQAGEAVAWREQWHGSPTHEGWSIMAGRERVAYLGRDVPSEVVSAICAAHNAIASLPAPQAVQAEPMRAHVEKFAAGSGWVNDGAEGAFEFVQRKCYHQGWQDGRREALGDVHRDTPEVAAPSPDGKAEQRPQNCGTSFCSCIECPFEASKAEQAEAPSDFDVGRDYPEKELLLRRALRDAWSLGKLHFRQTEDEQNIYTKHFPSKETWAKYLALIEATVSSITIATQPTASNAGEREALASEAREMGKLLNSAKDKSTMGNCARILNRCAAALASKPPAGEPLSDSYIQTVPDKCDRIIWRGRYYHLPKEPRGDVTAQPEQVAQDSAYPSDVEIAVPAIGSEWGHTNGDTYTVTGYADMFSDNHQRRPPRIIYRSAKTGRVWSRELSDWHRAMLPATVTKESST